MFPIDDRWRTSRRRVQRPLFKMTDNIVYVVYRTARWDEVEYTSRISTDDIKQSTVLKPSASARHFNDVNMSMMAGASCPTMLRLNEHLMNAIFITFNLFFFFLKLQMSAWLLVPLRLDDRFTFQYARQAGSDCSVRTNAGADTIGVTITATVKWISNVTVDGSAHSVSLVGITFLYSCFPGTCHTVRASLPDYP